MGTNRPEMPVPTAGMQRHGPYSLLIVIHTTHLGLIHARVRIPGPSQAGGARRGCWLVASRCLEDLGARQAPRAWHRQRVQVHPHLQQQQHRPEEVLSASILRTTRPNKPCFEGSTLGRGRECACKAGQCVWHEESEIGPRMKSRGVTDGSHRKVPTFCVAGTRNVGTFTFLPCSHCTSKARVFIPGRQPCILQPTLESGYS